MEEWRQQKAPHSCITDSGAPLRVRTRYTVFSGESCLSILGMLSNPDYYFIQSIWKNIQVYPHTDVMKRTFPEGALIKSSPEVSEMAKTGKSSPSLVSSVLFLKPAWWKETTDSYELSSDLQTQILEHTHLPSIPTPPTYASTQRI